MRAGKWLAGCSAVAVLAGASAARADLEISNHPTLNVSCSAGVCTATADKARLNANDLANMLASGDVAVKTGNVTSDIALRQPLSWTTASRLTLDAKRSIEIDRPMSVTGSGALTIVTNDGGKNGEFIVLPERGSVQFWDLNSSLVINGQAYTLVGDIKTLASDIAANPSGFYALAKDYDASADGTYSASPIPTSFAGVFDGMGNVVSNLAIHFPPNDRGVLIGFFGQVAAGGWLRNFALRKVDLAGTSKSGFYGAIGPLAGGNDGNISRCSTTGALKLPGGGDASPAGLVGFNSGTISASFSAVKISTDTFNANVAGIAGVNEGSVLTSYAQGRVAASGNSSVSGGLVGENAGVVRNAFAANPVPRGHGCCESLGGLVGKNDGTGQISASYAAGAIHSGRHAQGYLGGLVGFDDAAAGNISSSYWDIDDGVNDPAQGAGNLKNDPGISGMTTQELQSGLPSGFDPKIWTQSPAINKGLPYLRSVPFRHQ